MTMRIRAIAALGVVLLAVPALAGCSVIETTIEQVTGGDVEIGGNSVPEDFPGIVPLADGDVLNGSSASKDNNKVWNVTIRATDGVTFDSLAAELEGAGFARSEAVGAEAQDGQTGLFEGNGYSVLLTMTTQEAIGTIANYTVTALAQ